MGCQPWCRRWFRPDLVCCSCRKAGRWDIRCREIGPWTREAAQRGSFRAAFRLAPWNWLLWFRAGYVDTVVLQPGQVTCQGDFTHWTTAATPGLFAASWASEYASGPERIIAMMPHTDHDGNPTIVSQGSNALGWPRLRKRDCHRCGGDTGGPGRVDAGKRSHPDGPPTT